ncbi:MAG: 5-oxoprolinase subunit PxpA [Eubacteriales bacterium]|nr:5-oxoprolinase subunit PxpA [Eubacteriales bacterium]
MISIDLNCDLGESFGAYKIGMDEQVVPNITSANIACGFHAGDPLVMKKTVALCKKYGVGIGAHPGYPDLRGFGRRNMSLPYAEVEADIIYQVGALKAFCDGEGVPLIHVKPHGALYNMAGKDYDLAMAICRGILAVDKSLKILALSGSAMIRAAQEIGVPSVSEVFADRAYQADGSLVPRSQPGAMITDEDEAVKRVIDMAKTGTVTAIDGSVVAIRADSVCVHGDGEKALKFVEKIHKALQDAGIEVRSFS